MKYSIRGVFYSDEAYAATEPVFASYVLENIYRESRFEDAGFTFSTIAFDEHNKTELFEALKPFIDTFGGWMDWHFCSHGELEQSPCVIVETYAGV